MILVFVGSWQLWTTNCNPQDKERENNTASAEHDSELEEEGSDTPGELSPIDGRDRPTTLSRKIMAREHVRCAR